jgi:hypothetical protein
MVFGVTDVVSGSSLNNIYVDLLGSYAYSGLFGFTEE